MARVFTDGAEMNDLLFWDITSNGWVVATPWNGLSPLCYGVTGPWGYTFQKNFSSLSELYFRVRVAQGETPDWGAYPALFRCGSTNIAYVYMDKDTHTWRLYIGNTLVASSTKNFVHNLFYLIEVHLKIDDSSGVFQLKVDGDVMLTYSGDTKPGEDTTVDNLYYQFGNYWGVYLDDLAMNDTTGDHDNSWCGDGVVSAIVPSADGNESPTWTGSDENQTDNWALVDDFPSNGDTDYVYHSVSGSGDLEQFNLTNFDMTGKIILRLWPEVRARKTVAETVAFAVGIHPLEDTEDMGDTQDLTLSYARYIGNDYRFLPGTTDPWTQTPLNNLELVIQNAAVEE